MSLSQYFEDLDKAYRAELEDMQTDSEGKNVFAVRLKEKRQQFTSLMQMIEFAPEMVAPAFHAGINFTNPHALTMLSYFEPDEFPSWFDLYQAVQFEPWAEKLVDIAMLEPGGEQFMATVICLEYLHGLSSAKHANHQDNADDADNRDEAEDRNEHNDDDEPDLEEAGADWLAEQGFDRR